VLPLYAVVFIGFVAVLGSALLSRPAARAAARPVDERMAALGET
jgi:hypothetical protein